VAAACNSIRLYDTTTGEERLWINRKALHNHFTDNDKTLTGAVRGAIYVQNSSAGSNPACFKLRQGASPAPLPLLERTANHAICKESFADCTTNDPSHGDSTKRDRICLESVWAPL
jgi:hypothetical protein